MKSQFYYIGSNTETDMEEIQRAWYRTVSFSMPPPSTSSPLSSISYGFVQEFCQRCITWSRVTKSLTTRWSQLFASVSFTGSGRRCKGFSPLIKRLVCLTASSNSEVYWQCWESLWYQKPWFRKKFGLLWFKKGKKILKSFRNFSGIKNIKTRSQDGIIHMHAKYLQNTQAASRQLPGSCC